MSLNSTNPDPPAHDVRENLMPENQPPKRIFSENPIPQTTQLTLKSGGVAGAAPSLHNQPPNLQNTEHSNLTSGGVTGVAPSLHNQPPNLQTQATDDPWAGLHPWAKHIVRFALAMQDMPNYLGIHAGGIIISEAPLSEATALQLMPKGFPITHFDMYGAEEWGFHKFDVLSQRGLGHIKDAVDLVRKNQGTIVDIHDVERIKTDEKTREKLRSGHCIGCFYIESPAMRGLISKLRCDNYIHLVAASSIIRPGVAQSGMMRAYIQRYHAPQSFDYIHESFQKHLGETFGIMVYQEDVMKILHHFAGLGLDEADVMRRMMSGKKRSSVDFQRLQDKYFHNCREMGHSDELAQEVWRQIESFCGYSFCKAHSASYAVESFQSLYLKAHFPLEFMVAVINNFGGFYHTEFYVHELRMSGARVHAPCVNQSDYHTNIHGIDAHLGFVHVQGLEQALAKEIVHQRRVFGVFKGLDDFVRRVSIAPTQLDILIRVGAFRFTGLNKGELFWEKSRVLSPSAKRNLHQTVLFEDETADFILPSLTTGPFDQAFDELELLGFSLCSPFELLHPKEQQTDKGVLAEDLKRNEGKVVSLLGYYVCRKETRTIKGERMSFGTWLDADGRFFDSVHFPSVLLRCPFHGRGLYRIQGRVTSDFGFLSLETTNMERLSFRSDERW